MILGLVLPGRSAENSDSPRICALSKLATSRRSGALVRELAQQAMQALIQVCSRPAPSCVGDGDNGGRTNRSNASTGMIRQRGDVARIFPAASMRS